jgi:hypothetical protein
MFISSRRLVPLVAVAAAVLPAASAGAQDLRSPDSRDPVVSVQPQSTLDLRTPDARTATVVAVTDVDLRTPDAVDGASGSRRGVDVDPGIVRVSVPATTTVDDGFQWSDAGIGAGIVFALLVLSAGGYALMVAHRRSTGGTPLAH